MSVSFEMISAIDAAIEWRDQPFQGFCLDSRYIQKDQLFIALTSYSQPEKTRIFAETALAQGALGIISEQPLGLEREWVCADVRHRMGQWQKNYLQKQSLSMLHELSQLRAPMEKPPFRVWLQNY